MPDVRAPGFPSLAELEALAGAKVPPEIWDYIQGGAGEERTMRANRLAFERQSLRPRMLTDVPSIDPTTTILGQRVSVPFFVAPMAYQASVHPDGEVGTAVACQAARVLAVFSTLASHSFAQVACFAIASSAGLTTPRPLASPKVLARNCHRPAITLSPRFSPGIKPMTLTARE